MNKFITFGLCIFLICIQLLCSVNSITESTQATAELSSMNDRYFDQQFENCEDLGDTVPDGACCNMKQQDGSRHLVCS